MDEQFRMDSNSILVREDAAGPESTSVSQALRRRLRRRAMTEAMDFYRDFFGRSEPQQSLDELVRAYERESDHAHALGLFAPGGVREKDHLNYWCLGRVFQPRVYIESGVYIGSSLHAFIRCPGLEKVIAIDPNLTQLKVPVDEIPGAILVDDKDFSQLEPGELPERTLVYFDDHINTAQRIFQSRRMGLRYLLFDDSTGFEGISQRLYPAVPTIPMILNHAMFEPGDRLSWSFTAPAPPTAKGWTARFKRPVPPRTTRVTLELTDRLIDSCRRAGELIKRVSVVPDLGRYLPQAMPEKMVDTSKFLVELV